MVIVGIDAAWAQTEPSGVAVVEQVGATWRCRGVAPSYRQFAELAGGVMVDWKMPPPPGRLDAPALLRAAECLAGGRPDVIAVDMPLAKAPVVGRRVADNAVSRIFGPAGAGVYTPTPQRPGAVADRFHADLRAQGYLLGVDDARAGLLPGLIETYPHPVIMQLCNSRYRVPYKVGKLSGYWPGCPPEERRRRLDAVWACLGQALAGDIAGIELPSFNAAWAPGRAARKAIENALDALVCTLTGIAYASGTAVAYGDDVAAIWLPRGCESFRARPLPFGWRSPTIPRQSEA